MSTQPELKIIADHLRSSSFLIADGALPSNEGRGYVLRRIMRRAMRQLHKLGAKEVSMYKLVDALINEMGAAYPELARARAVIVETLKNEEEKFRETLEKGLKILEEEIAKTKNQKFSGAAAFKLYDTYGFPLDLTQDILKEKNLVVDLEEFNTEMEIQRERAKASWKGSGEIAEENIFFDLKEKFGETKFLGYENLEAKGKVLLVNDNFVILNQTPFYATSGGQKGDDGLIDDTKIIETKKFAGGLFVHFFAPNSKVNFKQDSEVLAKVNPQTRAARAANHSATHLMHKALKDTLGNSISQKGSNVDAESFTFDFNFNRAMTADEIKKIEDLVNAQIQKNSEVATKLMELEEAKNSGAEALFGEKYDAKVRVVSIANSVELCGGTHVKNVSEIEIFKIISEKSIASGIRRIEAKTSFGAKDFLAKKEQDSKDLIAQLQQKIQAKNVELKDIGGKEIATSSLEFGELEEVLKKQEREISRLKKEKLLANLSQINSKEIAGNAVIAHFFDNIEGKDLRDIATELNKKSDVTALFSQKDGKVSVCVSVGSKAQEKFDATKLIAPLIEAVGGKGGGGKKDFAMGGGVDKSGVTKAIEIFEKQIQS